MKLEDADLDQSVSHKSNGMKRGTVTAFIRRTSGTMIGVTWDDLVERWHSASELDLVSSGKPIGFQPS